jgi:transcriptional regulator GlxA family with amidase domain
VSGITVIAELCTRLAALALFKGQKNHHDEEVKQAQEFIEQIYQRRLSVWQLAGFAAIVRRSLEKRFTKTTHNIVVPYIQRVKMEASKDLLLSQSDFLIFAAK